MTTVTRQTPAGVPLRTGHDCKIAFSADQDISFWERGTTPPGVDGGDAIDNTTHHNATWRTMSPRALKTLTPGGGRVTYDPQVYTQIVALVNVETEITIHFPDTSTLDFWGFLKSFVPDELVEGSDPEATIEIIPTNFNPNSGNEVAPTMTDNGT